MVECTISVANLCLARQSLQILMLEMMRQSALDRDDFDEDVCHQLNTCTMYQYHDQVIRLPAVISQMIARYCFPSIVANSGEVKGKGINLAARSRSRMLREIISHRHGFMMQFEFRVPVHSRSNLYALPVGSQYKRMTNHSLSIYVVLSEVNTSEQEVTSVLTVKIKNDDHHLDRYYIQSQFGNETSEKQTFPVFSDFHITVDHWTEDEQYGLHFLIGTISNDGVTDFKYRLKVKPMNKRQSQFDDVTQRTNVAFARDLVGPRQYIVLRRLKVHPKSRATQSV